MRNSSEAQSSSPCRTRSDKIQLRSSKSQCKDPIQLSSKTPEKLSTAPPQRRTRNRGVALSVSEIRKVAKGLQDRKKLNETTTTSLSKPKTARRQISMSSPVKPKTAARESLQFPQKYEILAEFFDSLDNSIRLLRLKGSIPTFTNISPKVESLTDRRFTHGHLAQLKFILPEAIVIKKLLAFDERTCCMKPDLHVTIDPHAVESDAKLLPGHGTLPLKKLFRARLQDFCKSHPEGDEIPEETLPDPFSRPKQDPLLNITKAPSSSLSMDTLSDAHAASPPIILSASMLNSDVVNDPANIEKDLSVPVNASIEAHNQQPAVASHMSQAFRRRFSRKSKEDVADNVEQKFPSDSFHPVALPVSESSLKKNSTFEVTKSRTKACLTTQASSDCITSSKVTPATPTKTIDYTESKDGSLKSVDVMSTPAKFVATPSRLMSATPALPPAKRPYMSPDDNCSSPNKLAKRPACPRSLKFDTPVKNENNVGGLSIDDDVFDILPDNLLQSIREKERIANEERDPTISQAKKRKKAIASLPKLFYMIRMMFHSKNRSVITKEELISKIISNHSDITDRSEVEEQLHLLLELVPEWISEKLASSGDLLFCVNKMLNPDAVRASLEEAK